MTTPAPDDLLAELGNVRVRFWLCLHRDHKTVVWDGDVARCPDCGLTSEMTQRYQRGIRQHERARIAAEVRGRADQYETAAEQPGRNLGQIWDGKEQARQLRQLADWIETKETTHAD